MGDLADKYGIKIQPFDLLKVYHFTGVRGKKHYMYKLVVGNAEFSDDYFLISSLSECGHTYTLRKDYGVLPDVEILQGTNLDERRKATRTSS